MLTIRHEQFPAHATRADDEFVADLSAYLRENHADTLVFLPRVTTTISRLPSLVLDGMVLTGLARARRYRFQYESDLAAFIVLMFEAAPNFDQHPLINAILFETSRPAACRLKTLWTQVTDADWAEVEAAYDWTVWEMDWYPTTGVIEADATETAASGSA